MRAVCRPGFVSLLATLSAWPGPLLGQRGCGLCSLVRWTCSFFVPAVVQSLWRGCSGILRGEPIKRCSPDQTLNPRPSLRRLRQCPRQRCPIMLFQSFFARRDAIRGWRQICNRRLGQVKSAVECLRSVCHMVRDGAAVACGRHGKATRRSAPKHNLRLVIAMSKSHDMPKEECRPQAEGRSTASSQEDEVRGLLVGLGHCHLVTHALAGGP